HAPVEDQRGPVAPAPPRQSRRFHHPRGGREEDRPQARRSRRVPVQAVELSPEEAGAVLRRALEPFRRSRVFHALLGPHFRPPIGVLWRYRIRIDETPEEYVAEARRHPLFELRPMTEDID